MGTPSTKKVLKQVAGVLTEEALMLTSDGAIDANNIPALNAAGVLSLSIVNGRTTSVGAADTGRVVALDAAGRIDNSMMPVGIGADTATVTASEALAAGDYVNIWNNGGPRVRKASANTAGTAAMGFVLSSVASAGAATVFFEGTNTAVTGQTPGTVFLSVTAGLGTATAPSGVNQVVQPVGFAVSTTAVNFNTGAPITLA